MAKCKALTGSAVKGLTHFKTMCAWFVVVNGDEYEYRLMEDLLRGYDPRIRPSVNSSEPLNVTFGLALSQIIDVVSTTTAVLLNQSINEFLQWPK